MSEEEIKAIEYLKKHIIPYNINGNIEFLVNEITLNLISKLQKELDKKDKAIDLMAERLVEDSDVFNYQHSMTEEKWKEYFYEKAEEENE